MKNKTLPAQSLPISESGDDGARHCRQRQTRTGQHLSALRSSQRRLAWSKTDGNRRAEASSSSLTHLFQSVLHWPLPHGCILRKWLRAQIQSFLLTFLIHVSANALAWTCCEFVGDVGPNFLVHMDFQTWKSYLAVSVDLILRSVSVEAGKTTKQPCDFFPFCKTMQAP